MAHRDLCSQLPGNGTLTVRSRRDNMRQARN